MTDQIQIILQDEVLNLDLANQFVAADSCGGFVNFIGKVRNSTKNEIVNYLEFEAYKPMAKTEMLKVAKTTIEQFDVKKISIHHRIGKLLIGEIAVIISVSSAHRKNAFTACEFAIDTLKKTVPIFKKEFFANGEVWVNAHP